MYLPPVLVNLALMALFGKTLLSGATPLVSRVASLWRGTLDPVVSRYTRRVTIAWTVFFALMALESIGLALFAPGARLVVFYELSELRLRIAVLHHRVSTAIRLSAQPQTSELSRLLPSNGIHGSPNPRTLIHNGNGDFLQPTRY